MLKVTQLTKETKMKQESFEDFIKLYYAMNITQNITQSTGDWLGTRTTKKHHGNI